MASTEQNKTIVRAFIEGLSADLAAIDAVCSPGLVAHLPGNPAPADREGFKAFAALLYSAIPDLRHAVEDLIAEGDKVVCRVTVSGTQKGPLLFLPPTNLPVSFTDIIILRLREGRVAELWAQFDALSLLAQAGPASPGSNSLQ
jgi:predicted ester cyclase